MCCCRDPRRFVLLFCLATAFLIFAGLMVGGSLVVADAAEVATWPDADCHIVSVHTYQCDCTTDQYGHVSCDWCQDLTIEYTTEDGRNVTIVDGEHGRDYHSGETVDCRYNPDDYTEVRLDWSYPTLAVALLFGFAVVPICCCCVGCTALRGMSSATGGGKDYAYYSALPPDDGGLGVRAGRQMILFGPPGVGKRTILAAAAARGIETRDLIPLGRNYPERRAAAASLFQECRGRDVIYGAADLRASDVPPHIQTVLILPPRDEYLRRFRLCCEQRPEERAHNAPKLYHDFSRSQGIFSAVVRGSDSPEGVLDAVWGPPAAAAAAVAVPVGVPLASQPV